ncbi:TRAP transporter small permease [Chloroflexota bacterium]
MKWKETYDKFVNKWAVVFSWVAMFALLFMFVMSLVDVIGTKTSTFPVPGAPELLGLNLLVAAAFGIAYTETRRQHIRVDFFTLRMRGRVKGIFGCFNSIISMVIISLLIWASFVYSAVLRNTNITTETLDVLLFPFPIIIGISCIPLLLILFSELVDAVREVRQ